MGYEIDPIEEDGDMFCTGSCDACEIKPDPNSWSEENKLVCTCLVRGIRLDIESGKNVLCIPYYQQLQKENTELQRKIDDYK